MPSESLSLLLSEIQQQHYNAIMGELTPLIEAESYPQAIARVDMILNTIPIDQDNRLLRAVMLATRGELHMEAEDYEEAEEDIRHALHNGARHWAVYSLSGWVHYHMDRLEKSREHFDRAIEDNSDALSALTGRALVLQDLNEYELARADLTHAIHCAPNNDDLYAMRGEVALRLQDIEQAERDLLKAKELGPEDGDNAITLARLFIVTRRMAQALKLVDNVIKNDEHVSLDALLLRSHLHLLQGSIKEARTDAINASNRFPDEAFAFVQLAHVQLAQDNAAMALKAAERAVKLDPSLPDAYTARGSAHRLKGNATAADADFQRASQADSELPLFLLGPAYDLLQSNDFDPAHLGSGAGTGASMPEMPSMDIPGFGGMNPFGGMPGGMDPMKMMGQLFDEEGNIRGPFKPLMQMALKNAPTLLKNMPPSLLKNMGGMDPEMLKHIDMDNISPQELEAQMKEFAKMVKSGENPMDLAKRAQDELKKKQGND